MIDRDFEQRGALLTNDGYFSRVRELCKTMSVEEAWIQIESELPFGLRRYTHIYAFKNARKREANGSLQKPQFKGG